MINFKKIFIVLTLCWGILRCDSFIDHGDSNIQREDNYVQLAKKYEQIYLPELLGKTTTKPKLSPKELEKIAQRHHFDEEKIANYKKEVLRIAASYGLDVKDITLEKYFFIHPYSGEILDKDYYYMGFAYIKYLKEKLASSFNKVDKMNKQISTLTRKYMKLVEETKDSLKQQKLMEEYARKKKKIIKSFGY